MDKNNRELKKKELRWRKKRHEYTEILKGLVNYIRNRLSIILKLRSISEETIKVRRNTQDKEATREENKGTGQDENTYTGLYLFPSSTIWKSG